jgi:hypothetical protein
MGIFKERIKYEKTPSSIKLIITVLILYSP